MPKKSKTHNDAATERITLGVDLGGTKILAGVVDAQGRVVAVAKAKTKGEQGVDAVIERIHKTALKALERAGLDLDAVGVVGIGVPGVANHRTGVLEFAPNLPDWTDVPLGGRLEALFDAPVFVENDVNAGAFGEATAGAGRGYNSVVGVFPGTGIGGGIVLDGRLLRGARNAAAEIGHMVMQIDGPLCGCGRRGCIEALASRTAIDRDIWGEIRGGRASAITQLVGDSGRITSGTLAEALALRDGVVTDVMERASHHLGVFTASLVNALDPECIVYGGGLIEACADFMLPIIRETAYRYLIRPVDPADLPILEAALGDNANIVGSAMLAQASLYEREAED